MESKLNMTGVVLNVSPEPKRRARTLKSGRSYDPKENKSFAKNIQAEFLKNNKEWVKPSKDIGIHVSLTFYFPHTNEIKKQFEKMSIPKFISMKKRPDLDNLVKAVLDALNGIAYEDDGQVVSLWSWKYYSPTYPDGAIFLMINEEITE